MTFSATIKIIATLLLAEIIASYSIWCGTPVDWSAEALHFWEFEFPRLPYWALSLLVSGLAYLVISPMVRARSSALARYLLAGILLLAAEMLNSLICWLRLPWTKTSCISLTYSRYYFSEHLASWILVVTLGMVLIVVMRRTAGGALDRRKTDE